MERNTLSYQDKLGPKRSRLPGHNIVFDNSAETHVLYYQHYSSLRFNFVTVSSRILSSKWMQRKDEYEYLGAPRWVSTLIVRY